MCIFIINELNFKQFYNTLNKLQSDASPTFQHLFELNILRLVSKCFFPFGFAQHSLYQCLQCVTTALLAESANARVGVERTYGQSHQTSNEPHLPTNIPPILQHREADIRPSGYSWLHTSPKQTPSAAFEDPRGPYFSATLGTVPQGKRADGTEPQPLR